MDWVQWYAIFWIVLGIVMHLLIHGQPKTGKEDFRWFFCGMLLTVPTYGRIFGWW